MIDIITEFLLAHWMLIVGPVAGLVVLRKVLPEAFTGWRSRIAPLYPIALCVAGALSGLTTYEKTIEVITVGVICGVIAAYSFKLFKPILEQVMKKTFGVSLPDK